MDRKYTVSGTDIAEVKRKNSNSGLTYNEVKALMAEKRNKAPKTSR